MLAVDAAYPSPPEPGQVDCLDDLSRALGGLRAWAGNPSYAVLTDAIGALRAERGDASRPGKVTVYDCFREGRKRLDAQLFVDLIEVLGVPRRAQPLWQQAYRVALGQPSEAILAGGVSVQLPPPRTRLIGRDQELDQLATCGPGSISLIVGLAGAGKTELALHVTNRWLRQLGPDALGLAVDLRGFDPDLEPLASAAMLARLLGAVGVPASRFDGLAAYSMAELLREAVGGRPLVLLLDNAHGAGQILPLLPIGRRWRVVVTSRRRLAELEPSAAHHLVLGELSPAAALQVLAGEIGASRVGDEPIAAAQIAGRCGLLALDLRLAGAAIAAESDDWTLADHVIRLAALPADEMMRPALWLSYQALTTPIRRLLRLAALHPGPWLSQAQLVALAGLDPEVVADQVAVLLGEHLLSAEPLGYVLHDLVRAFALRQAVLEDPRSQQVAAIRRLATVLVAEAEAHAVAGRPDSNWLEEHLPVLQAFAEVAADWGLSGERARLVLLYSEFLDTSGRLAMAEGLIGLALTSADAEQELLLRRKLGRVLELRGDLDAALAELTRAAVPGSAEYGRALNGIGNVCKRSGRHREAVTYYCRAARNAAGPMDHGRALGNLADTLRVMGHGGIAEPIFDAGEALGRQADDVVGLAIVAGNRCILVEEQGRAELAAQLAREATARFERLGFVAPSLTVQQVVIRCLIVMGELAAAREALVAADAQARATGMELIGCELRFVAANLLAAEGRTAAAKAEHEEVIAEAGRLGAAPVAIRAYNELGQLLVAEGRHDEARSAFDSAAVLAQANGDRLELVKARQALAGLDARAGALDSR